MLWQLHAIVGSEAAVASRRGGRHDVGNPQTSISVSSLLSTVTQPEMEDDTNVREILERGPSGQPAGPRAHTMAWGGGLNFIWFIDRKYGLCAVAAPQLSMPPDMGAIIRLKTVFRKDIYGLYNDWKEKR
jgi:hypothetical protein